MCSFRRGVNGERIILCWSFGFLHSRSQYLLFSTRGNSSGRFFGAIADISAGPSPMKWLRISILLCQSLQIALMTRKIGHFSLSLSSATSAFDRPIGRIAFVHHIDNWNWPTNFKFIFLSDAIPIKWSIRFYFIFPAKTATVTQNSRFS